MAEVEWSVKDSEMKQIMNLVSDIRTLTIDVKIGMSDIENSLSSPDGTLRVTHSLLLSSLIDKILKLKSAAIYIEGGTTIGQNYIHRRKNVTKI